MADIADRVRQIRQSIYGKDVREAIASSLEDMNTNVSDAEAYAVGTREEVPVQEGDKAFENNAEFYAGVAGDKAREAAASLEDLLEETEELSTLAKGAYASNTVSGETVDIDNASGGIPFKDISVNVLGSQTIIEGGPSPEVPCPIIGYDSVIIYHKNDPEAEPTTYTIPFDVDLQDFGPVNTKVYAGTLDITTGLLIVKAVLLTFDGTETYTDDSVEKPVWNTLQRTGYPKIFAHRISKAFGYYKNIKINSASSYNKCSRVMTRTLITSTSGAGYYAYTSSGSAYGQLNTRISVDIDTLYPTVEDWTNQLQEWYSNGQPLQCAFGISSEENITYQLSKTEVRTFLERNMLSSDAGTVEVQYYLDPQSGIDVAKNKVEDIIADGEGTFVATKDYAVGDRVIINDMLFRITNPISTGQTFIEGSNTEQTTVDDLLKKAELGEPVFNILSIGSSQTQSNWGYVPEIIRRIAPNAKFNFGNLYRSGTEIEEYVAHQDESSWDGNGVRYNEWNADNTAWQHFTGISLNDALARKKWDIIYGHISRSDNRVTSLNYSNSFLEVARKKCSNFKYVTGSMHPSRASGDKGESGVITQGLFYDDIVHMGGFEDYIPIAEALQNAKSKPEACHLGVIGYMRFNRTTSGFGTGHLQNGFPVLVSSYVIAAKILEWCGYDYRGIIGNDWVPTTEETYRIGCMVSGKDAYMTHGESHFMSGNDTDDPIILENVIKVDLPFAQRCAILAIENPYQYLPANFGAYGTNDSIRIAGYYNPNHTYDAEDYCTYQNVFWKCRSKTVLDYDTSALYSDGDRFRVDGMIYKLVPEYSSANSYWIEDCCLYDDKPYFCVANADREEFDGSKWKEFEIYSSSKTYKTFDVCQYNNILYICKNADTTGTFNVSKWYKVGELHDSKWIIKSSQEFDSSKWQQITITDALKSLNERFTILNDYVSGLKDLIVSLTARVEALENQ